MLLRSGFQVTVLDTLEKGHREALPEEVPLVCGNCGDPVLLEKIFAENNFDAVLHFAAYIEAGESMEGPERFFINNTARPLVLLEAMLKAGVKKFVSS